LEVTSHEPLTDKQVLHFYELPKLPPLDSKDSNRDLWLKLFNAKTEEELTEIEKLEVPIMREALQAYRHVAASEAFILMERMRSKTRHDEAQALRNAQRQRDEHWQVVVAEKDTTIAEQGTTIAEKDTTIAEQGTALAEKDTTLAEQAALIAELLAQLANK